MGKRRRELIFKGGNRDGDEFIDFETFCEMPTYAGRSEEELRSVFEQFQVDHQGRIDRRELDSHKREDQGKADECGCDISFINELRTQDLLTDEQHRRAVELAREDDQRVLGALQFQARNRMRAAMLLAKVTSSPAAAGQDSRAAHKQ